MRDLVAGSHDALAALYDRHASLVYGTATRVTRDTSTAEEVVSETFLALWNRADQFDPARASLEAWLVVLARSRAIDLLRRTARHRQGVALSALGAGRDDPAAVEEWALASARPIASGTTSPEPHALAEAVELRETLGSMLATLPDDERIPLVLAYRDGLSQAEVASHLDWPIGTVKTRTRRGLARLRAALGPLLEETQSASRPRRVGGARVPVPHPIAPE